RAQRLLRAELRGPALPVRLRAQRAAPRHPDPRHDRHPRRLRSLMTKLFPRLALASAVLALVGCVEDLDPIAIVVTPRILAIVAEAPESAPGVDVEVDAMISIPDD